MTAIVRPQTTKGAKPAIVRPSRAEAEQAVETLLRWAGDDPTREGLLDTPARVAKAYEEWFSGYNTDPEEYMKRTFEEVAGYDDMWDPLESTCRHASLSIL